MQITYPSQRIKDIPIRIQQALPKRLVESICQSAAASVEELRLHSGRISTITSYGKNIATDTVLTEEELKEILKQLCSNSLYTYGDCICRGYVALEGGIRVGVCGSAAVEGERVIGVHRITSLCIRIPHRIQADVTSLLPHLFAGGMPQSSLLYAPPGVGKTTLLRALAEQAASPARGIRTVIVDTREELSFGLTDKHLTLDVLRGYPRGIGMEIAVRSMGASLIVCDEIGNEADATALLAAANCGVAIFASAHAQSLEGLLRREAFQTLDRAAVFENYVGISRERTRFFYDVRTKIEKLEMRSFAT